MLLVTEEGDDMVQLLCCCTLAANLTSRVDTGNDNKKVLDDAQH